MLDAIRLAHPAALAWLVVLPLLWICDAARRAYRTRSRRRTGVGPTWARLSSLSGSARDVVMMGCSTAAVIMLVLTLAQLQMSQRVPEYETFDLIVLLDRSASMLATDVSPSRLARACVEVEGFLRRKPETIDRIALVAVAGTSIVTSHLTADLEILSFFLDWMQRDETPFYGTDLAASLERAVAIAANEHPERRKVIVLLSDGEDHGDLLRSAVAKVRSSGMPVYTVGVGGDAPASIPAPRGSDTPTLRDDDDRVLQARFSEGTLRQIAAATNGRYFRAERGDELAPILAAVSNGERRPVRYHDAYHSMDTLTLGGAAVALSGLLVLL